MLAFGHSLKASTESVVLPDHEFIVTTVSDMVDISRGEQIVRDIGVDVGVVVAPLHRSWNTANLANELLGECKIRVGVTLDRG